MLGLMAVALPAYIMFVISFLSVTQRVDADVLVIEAWVQVDMMESVAEEFARNHYSLLLISGLQHNPDEEASAVKGSLRRTLLRLEELGVPRDRLIPCPAPFAEWRRTAKSAQAVRGKVHELGLKPRGINVITEGTHARESWVAYRHIFGKETPVGIVAVPKPRPPGFRWWTSTGGWFWITKDFLGWLKEYLFPIRT